ncbi:MAG: dephospho-CoA kinase [Flavobacteriaceae bacterium]|nr:dephospho-CoA kinase [Flavobacteriaceae bacterium]
MKIIGLTGGIGSGKTTVAGFFSELGVPVYIADIEAKKLMNRSKVIRKKLIALLGPETYIEEGVNRKFVANAIFNNKELLAQVNSIVHPKVASHFMRWMKKQNASYCIKEAAILFENGSYQNCDATILVTAPISLRIKRVLKRDDMTLTAIEDRMSNQWKDERKLKLADYHIENTSLTTTKVRVIELHELILKG